MIENDHVRSSPSLPSPKNSDLNAIFADQTLTEFLGEGLVERAPSLQPRWLNSGSAPSKYERFINLRSIDCDYPSPPAPHPREFGQRLILSQRVEVRIPGERGAS